MSSVRTLARLFAPAALLAIGTAVHAQTPQKATVTIHADSPGAVISRNIYGQFSEHLGRGVYEGIWVGEDSDVPNTNGYRNDVVQALKELRVPMLRWPGGSARANLGLRRQHAAGVFRGPLSPLRNVHRYAAQQPTREGRQRCKRG